MKQKLIFLNLLWLLLVVHSYAQQTIISNTKNNILTTQTETVKEGALYIVEKITMQQFTTPMVNIENIATSVVKNTSTTTKINFPTSFTPTVYIGKERKQNIAFVVIPQYIKNAQGVIEKLTQYQLVINEPKVPLQKTLGNRVYATNSVLASGGFYKIALANQGVYKIDYDFIKNKVGIDPSTINPANIRLYGNGGTPLAENNAVFRADDLAENAIQMIDGGDGKFDNGDYFLFYANGPHAIVNDSINKKCTHQFNIYSEQSFYFLNFDLGAGKRIAKATNPTTSNVTVNSFNDYQFVEKDSVNFGHNGQKWWGFEMNDLPGRLLSRTFTFNFPNIDVNTPILIHATTGAVTHSASSTMSIAVNGTQISNEYYGAYGYAWSDPNIQEDTTPFFTTPVNSSLVNLSFNFNKGSSESAGFIDFIGINAKRNLVNTGYINFIDFNSIGNGNVANFQIQNANSNLKVWDITHPLEPTLQTGILNNNVFSFNQEATYIHRYIAFDESILNSPSFVSKIENQNLHALQPVDYIIIAHSQFVKQATQLAQHHANKRAYKYAIVTPQEIYNEFSSGSQDVSAIRDFIKMLYDKASTQSDIPKNVLFFGDASYDYKDRITGNTNLVPTYETVESNNKSTAYCTDDFFGFLDDNENVNNFGSSQINTIDIGVGRIPVYNQVQANAVLNKIINYDSPKSFGAWKNDVTFNADNADGQWLTHMGDAESVNSTLQSSSPIYNSYKIYVDAYNVESTPGGSRCPDANRAIREQMYNGTFLMNYSGHGAPHSWGGERIFSQDDINVLKNEYKLPLFITATCDFAPYDNPADYSGGEILLSKADGGAIALMTTTQLVFSSWNQAMNSAYMLNGLKPMSNGNFPTLGDAFRLSKNIRYISSIGEMEAGNYRKFALLGDPGLPLCFPIHQVSTDSINGVSIQMKQDTLKSLEKYTISGHVADRQGNVLTNFNGIVYPTIFDKPKKLSTLQQNGADKGDFYVQNNAIYKGKATVKDGKFSFTFVVPKDINYEIAQGKISYYANNTEVDANGFDNTIYIGGSSGNANSDNQGPIIKAYMNDEKFVDGGIVTANSTLLLKLSDDNGINYTGNSVGHDITAVLDGNIQNTFVLNKFFEANLDDYRSGTVKFPVNNLSVGTHTFTIKAWDIFNNSSQTKITFEVVNEDKATLSHVYNYPNPFNNNTQFMFEHNMPNQNLQVSIQVITATGKVVKTIHAITNSTGTRVNNIEWDGKDEFGNPLGNGTYLYKLHVKGNNFSATKMEKLIILH